MKTLILSGGTGTRLWPLSREYYPKQFIDMGGKSLFQLTCLRACKISKPADIWIVTNEKYKYIIKNQIEEIDVCVPETNIILEPIGRNTLPAITLAIQYIRDIDSESVVCVLPSDHLLSDSAMEKILECESIAKYNIVTFGIAPTNPNIGYGYIKPGNPSPTGGSLVENFKEKPSPTLAQQYVKDGYLWNSGMFLLYIPLFFEELEKYCKEYLNISKDYYSSLNPISIDKGLLEYTSKLVVVKLDAEWSDLGTFKSLYNSKLRDENGNVGEAVYINSNNNYVNSHNKCIGLIGVNNLIIVDTDDALLLCDENESEKVKDLVEIYKTKNKDITEFHRRVYRPWGSYSVLYERGGYKIKHITIKEKQSVSLQMHHHRSEHWVVVSGAAEVNVGNETKLLCNGESIFVKSGVYHRIKNPGNIPLEIIEVQLGEYLGENDIVRSKDNYGRK